jgi:hypothetical protein
MNEIYLESKNPPSSDVKPLLKKCMPKPFVGVCMGEKKISGILFPGFNAPRFKM